MTCETEKTPEEVPASPDQENEAALSNTTLDSQSEDMPVKQEGSNNIDPEETAMILTSLSKPGGKTMPDRKAKGKKKVTPAKRKRAAKPEPKNKKVRAESEEEDAFDRESHRIGQVNFDGPEGKKLDFTDAQGNAHSFHKESNRVKSLVTSQIGLDELRRHFDRPILDVAKDFGVCITLMKKICRRNGINRWPHRQIRSISKSIASMEAALLSASGPEKARYRQQIDFLRQKRELVISDPSAHAEAPGSSVPKNKPTKTYRKKTPREKEESGEKNASKGGRWTAEEHAAFLEGIRLYGKEWRRVAQVVKTRSAVQTRTHAQKYLLKFAGSNRFDAPSPAILGGNFPVDKQEPTESYTSMMSDGKEERDDTFAFDLSAYASTMPADGDNGSNGDGIPSLTIGISSLESDPTNMQLQDDNASAGTEEEAPVRSPPKEAMAMILNSPEFRSQAFQDSMSGNERKQMEEPLTLSESHEMADLV